MSLKAKIEAVIYASEEPVTLAQLVGLLGQEAQAELDRMESRQQSLDLPEEPLFEGLASEVDETAAHANGGGADAQAAEVNDAGPESPETSLQNPDTSKVPDVAPASPVPASERKAEREWERRLREFFRERVDELIRDYATSDRGLEVREVAGGFRLGTKPEYHDAVRGFVRSLKPVLKLSLQALETLAVVAYKQPVTAPEISEIRGVDSGGVLGSLMGRKLITTAGRKQVIGRPILYKTTKDFLLRFGLKDISELPSIEEFEKMAGELVEQEEIPMPEAKTEGREVMQRQGETDTDTAEDKITHENLREMADATEPQADGDSDDLNTSEELSESGRSEESLPAVDGRMSGMQPAYEKASDPSGEEAAIQSGEGVE